MPEPQALESDPIEFSPVVYDACVLYPATLRDLLIELAVSRIFLAHWTDTIHDEWIRNLLEYTVNVFSQIFNNIWRCPGRTKFMIRARQ
jgi:hypothetical protein